MALPAAAEPVPLKSHQRISSTNGFSFQPPQGDNWLEEFGKNQITYLKQTDPRKVSFYVGAVEGKLRARPSTKEDLVAFVRSKKDVWGNDDRYSSTSASFKVEDKNESCIRYRLSAHDRDARNKSTHDFLIMHANGRFCLHPQDRAVAVDLYYSVRHAPTFDPKALMIEGEAFVQSLKFDKPK